MPIDPKRLDNPFERGRIMHAARATNGSSLESRREATEALRAWAAKHNASTNSGPDAGTDV